MSEPFLSEIRILSFVFAPKGWAICNGQSLPVNQNQALFSLLGNTFGGDGRYNNFALPDLRGRTPLHIGGGHNLGERGGEQAHTLSIAEIPTHTHLGQASNTLGQPVASAGNILSHSGDEKRFASEPSNMTTMHPATVTTVGGSQAHLNMQPFLTLNFCIALQGIFPSPS